MNYTQRYFDWGPTVSETPEQARERQENWPKVWNRDILWQNLYWDFKAPEEKTTEPKNETKGEPKIESKEKPKAEPKEQPEWETTEQIETDPKEQPKGNDEKNWLTKFKVEESKYYPLINRLFVSKKISNSSFDTIKKNITENQWELNLDNLTLGQEEKELLKTFVTKLDEKSEKQNISDFWNDIKNLDEFKGFKIELDENGKFDSEVLNLVWKNYLKIPETEDKIDVKSDVSTAIEITKNKILKEVKNIPKDSQTYLTSIQNISSGNLKKQIEWINSLYILSYSSEWKLAKGSSDVSEYKKIRKEQLMLEWGQLEQEIQKTTDLKKLEELNKRKEEIVNEMSELTWVKDGKKVERWELFPDAWKMDKTPETLKWNETKS